jgi:hypothetical protein
MCFIIVSPDSLSVNSAQPQVDRVMDEFESKKGDSQRKKDIFPAQWIVAIKVKSQSSKKIPILEDAEENHGLNNPYQAKNRSLAVESAEE